MPSAANGKSEKTASSEATDNSPIRQIMTIIEHKIRNLEKRKSKLTSYRDLQKAGKELHADQKVAVAKYDEVTQTLEFARELSKQVMGIITSAEREAKKQAKKEAWVKYAVETNKIREVLLIMDCLTQMGSPEARDDFLNGTNGAVKLTEEDLRILDDLYSEVTPKHELNEDGQPAFVSNTNKAAEHLWQIIDGKPKEVIGTTYAHIKEIVSGVHNSAYFDRSGDAPVMTEAELPEEPAAPCEPSDDLAPLPPPPAAPAPAVVPAPVYPLRPLPPITLQEVEHAYFAQQYGQQRPIAEVIGSQNFFFLQESEIDSPAGTPQPPMMAQASPPGQIPTQTYTNPHFAPMPLPPQPHFPPHPDHAGYAPVAAGVPMIAALPPLVAPAPHMPPAPLTELQPNEESQAPLLSEDNVEDEWKESESPDRVEPTRPQGQGDGGRYRRGGRGRGAPNGYRGRGGYSSRGDHYRDREYQPRGYKDGEYQPRSYKDGDYNTRGHKDSDYQSRGHKDGDYNPRGHKDGDYQSRGHKDGDYQPRGHKDGDYQSRGHKDGDYQPRGHKDGYQNRNHDGYTPRHKDYRTSSDNYYGNGDTNDAGQENGREAGGYKSRGRGGPRGGTRGNAPPRSVRSHQYTRSKQDQVQ